MGITVTTAATVTDLTTVPTVKRELDISNDTDDALFDELIAEASDFMRKYTGRVFSRETITETLPGTGHIDLYLSRLPIISITSITLNNVLVPTDQYTLDKANIGRVIHHDDGAPPAAAVWPLSSRPTSGISQHIQWGSFANNISAVYVSGYLLPAETSPTLPSDLQRVCIELVKWFYENRKSNPNIRFEKIGDSSQALDVAGQIPLTIRMVLDRWTIIPVGY